jgi:hypothetical protein
LIQNSEDKFVLDVFVVEKAPPVAKDYIESLKGAFSAKNIARMKKEAVDCPVKKRIVSFIECFACSNFNRRIKGKVACRGLPLNTEV